MSETKVQPTHLRRAAVVYVRQSTVAQVEQNRESTRRQYDLAERARQFGWRTDQITVLDEDLGLSAATTRGRGGFARMTAQVALGHVGILLGLEVSRLARNNRTGQDDEIEGDLVPISQIAQLGKLNIEIAQASPVLKKRHLRDTFLAMCRTSDGEFDAMHGTSAAP